MAAKTKTSKAKCEGDQIGRNVYTRIEGRKLIVEIDLDAPTQKSSSGKNDVCATTGGNQAINDAAKDRVGKLGINFYFPPEA